jgi:hypothetical protein
MFIAFSLAAALQVWTIYLLRGRSPMIEGAWRLVHAIFFVVWLGCTLAILTRRDFPVWALILLLGISALESAAMNYFFGVRGRRLTIGSSDRGASSSMSKGVGR